LLASILPNPVRHGARRLAGIYEACARSVSALAGCIASMPVF
jgi:hypothetical protein